MLAKDIYKTFLANMLQLTDQTEFQEPELDLYIYVHICR